MQHTGYWELCGRNTCGGQGRNGKNHAFSRIKKSIFILSVMFTPIGEACGSNIFNKSYNLFVCTRQAPFHSLTSQTTLHPVRAHTINQRQLFSFLRTTTQFIHPTPDPCCYSIGTIRCSFLHFYYFNLVKRKKRFPTFLFSVFNRMIRYYDCDRYCCITWIDLSVFTSTYTGQCDLHNCNKANRIVLKFC